MRFSIVIVLIVLLSACSEVPVQMNEVETDYAKMYQAERVSITVNNSTTETNGELVESRNYLLFEFYNSSKLIDLFDNQKLLENECKKIAESLINLIEVENEMVYDEIQIDVIKEGGFWIFENTNTKTITFDLEGD